MEQYNEKRNQTIIGDWSWCFKRTGTGWTLLAKIEDVNVANSIGFSMTGQGTLSGTWQVNANAWDSFAQGDILGVLKAGNTAAAYEIDLSSTSGDWSVTSAAWPNNAISHFSFWSRESTYVPEPSVIALLSLGFVGLGLSARRNKKSQ